MLLFALKNEGQKYLISFKKQNNFVGDVGIVLWTIELELLKYKFL